MGVGPGQGAAVDEDGGSAADANEFAVFDAGIDFGGGLRAAEASLEGFWIQSGAGGEVHHFVVGVGGRNQILVVINKIVHLPEGFRVLLVGAAASDGGSACPRMNLVNGEILEDKFDLGIVGEHAAHGVVEIAADGAFEVTVLDDGDGRFGITIDRSAFEIELGDVGGQRIGGEVVQFPAQQIAAVGAEIHFYSVAALGTFHVYSDFGEAGGADGFGRADGDGVVGAEGVVIAEEGFDRFLGAGGGLLTARQSGREDEGYDQ